MKTDIDIKTDIYRALKSSELASAVNGEIFRGKRPDGRNTEDIVIQVPDNMNGQVQKLYVTVNIYVPDIYNDENGMYEEDEQRENELAKMVVPVFDNVSFQNGFRTQVVKQKMLPEESINQHFIYNQLLYKYCNE